MYSLLLNGFGNEVNVPWKLWDSNTRHKDSIGRLINLRFHFDEFGSLLSKKKTSVEITSESIMDQICLRKQLQSVGMFSLRIPSGLSSTQHRQCYAVTLYGEFMTTEIFFFDFLAESKSPFKCGVDFSQNEQLSSFDSIISDEHHVFGTKPHRKSAKQSRSGYQNGCEKAKQEKKGKTNYVRIENRSEEIVIC